MRGLDSAVTQPLGQQNTYERWSYLKIRTLTPTSHFSRNNHRGREFIARFYESFKIYQVSGEWGKCVKKGSQTVIFIEPLFNETSGCLVNHIRHLCIG